MKIFKLMPPEGWAWERSAFHGAVICAESETQARSSHPNGRDQWNGAQWSNKLELSGNCDPNFDWPPADRLLVTYLGEAAPETEPGFILIDEPE